MTQNLGINELQDLLKKVFTFTPAEKALTLFTDLPTRSRPDTIAWKSRRSILIEWNNLLTSNKEALPFANILFCCYDNVLSNNNDLPEEVFIVDHPSQENLTQGRHAIPLEEVLRTSSIVIAMTEFSATAPLKILAKKHGFRGATLPGFLPSMIPSLSLDYEKIHSRVMQIKTRMDKAESISVILKVNDSEFRSTFDTRFRSAHASGGLMREAGTVGNLPSGEAYIVPYEGEKENEPSKTSGVLPVQFAQEIVVYCIEGNRATKIESTGPFSALERIKIREEPAYGNIAEVGIGVLGEWGVQACGSLLMDEKLGLHIAFGRSDHFNGSTGPAQFKDRNNVVHIDRVYVPSLQPLVSVEEVRFSYSGAMEELIMKSGKLVV